MTPEKFNWLLHVMLVYHTHLTIKKQDKKKQKAVQNQPIQDDSSDNNSDSENE